MSSCYRFSEMRFGVAIFLASSVAATLTFLACGDSTFNSAASTDAAADAASDSSSAIGPDAAAVDASDPCLDGSTHALCDDFDQPNISGVWGVFGTCPIPRLDSSESVSPPQSLRTSTDEAGVPSPNCATFYVTFGKTPTAIHCEADVKLDELPTATFDFFAVNTTFADGVSYHQVALNFSGNPGMPEPVSLGEETSFSDAGGSYVGNAVTTGLAPLSGWFHVALSIDYAKRLAATTVAGNQQVLPLQFVPDGGHPSSDIIFRPGIVIYGDGGVATAHYDNVFCDVN